MKRAQILHGYVHFVFEGEEYPIPPWPPTAEGGAPEIIDLVGENEDAERGDGWNPEKGKVVPRPKVIWNKEKYSFDIAVRKEKS